MTIHVVIITYQRLHQLKRALNHLFAAQIPQFNFNYTILINGPDTPTQEYLSTQQNINVLKSQDRKTPAAARLEILKTIKIADWIYFSDDDAFVDDSFFSRFYSVLQCNPGFDVYGGPNLTPANATEFEQTTGNILGNRYLTFAISHRYAKRPALANCNENHLILCNLFLKFPSLNKFSLPGFWPGGEENYAIKNLIRSGGRCFYSPDLYVYHDRRSNLKSFSEQMFKYGMGRGLGLKLYFIAIVALLPPLYLLHLLSKTSPRLNIITSLYLYYLTGVVYGIARQQPLQFRAFYKLP